MAAASAHLGDAIDRRVVDTQGFRFVDMRTTHDINFLPGAVKYGDMPALLALSTPHPLWICGEEGEVPKLVHAAYQSLSAADNLHGLEGNVMDLVRVAFEKQPADR